MFSLNTIEQLFLFVEQKDQLEVCLPYSRLLLFQILRWNSNKTSLDKVGIGLFLEGVAIFLVKVCCRRILHI